mmetsp:Transcript_4062/g.12700  ORF Transcript_4062/g.12700 Transcript_4062/m.12700 type:complete len:303 (+) Transcript_4062:810-1718(+)
MRSGERRVKSHGATRAAQRGAARLAGDRLLLAAVTNARRTSSGGSRYAAIATQPAATPASAPAAKGAISSTPSANRPPSAGPTTSAAKVTTSNRPKTYERSASLVWSATAVETTAMMVGQLLTSPVAEAINSSGHSGAAGAARTTAGSSAMPPHAATSGGLRRTRSMCASSACITALVAAPMPTPTAVTAALASASVLARRASNAGSADGWLTAYASHDRNDTKPRNASCLQCAGCVYGILAAASGVSASPLSPSAPEPTSTSTCSQPSSILRPLYQASTLKHNTPLPPTPPPTQAEPNRSV